MAKQKSQGMEDKQFWEKQTQKKKVAFWWELALLACMIIIIASVSYLSPLIMSPKGQFIMNYESLSYNTTVAISGIAANFSSSNFNINLMAGEQVAAYSGQNYNLQLGSGYFIYTQDSINGTLIVNTLPVNTTATIKDSDNAVVLTATAPFITNLTPGTYSVSFSDYEGLSAPTTQTAEIYTDQQKTVTGVYSAIDGPAIFDYQTTPQSNSNYSKTQSYSFTTGIANKTPLQNIKLSIERQNANNNYDTIYLFSSSTNTIQSLPSMRYAHIGTIPPLAAGSYNIIWEAWDSTNKYARKSWNYQINRADPNITLYLNENTLDLPISQGSLVNISSTVASNQEIIISIDGNEIKRSQGAASIIINTSAYTRGLHSVIAYVQGSENWTQNTVERRMDVANIGFISYSELPLSGTIFSQSQLYTFSSSWDSNPVDVAFEMRSSQTTARYNLSAITKQIENEKYTFIMQLQPMPAGNYTYTWLVKDSTGTWKNFTKSYEIKKAPLALSLKFGKPDSILDEKSKIFGKGQTIMINATSDIQNKTVCIKVVRRLISSTSQCAPTSIAIPYSLDFEELYNLTAYFEEDQNYSSTKVIKWVVVPAGTDNIPVYVDTTGQSADNLSANYTGKEIFENYYQNNVLIPKYNASAWAYVIDNTLIENAHLLTNETGTWKQRDSKYINAPDALINFTWASSVRAGSAIWWKINITDAYGNSFVTEPKSFNVYDASDKNYDKKIDMKEILRAITSFYHRTMAYTEVINSAQRWMSNIY